MKKKKIHRKVVPEHRPDKLNYMFYQYAGINTFLLSIEQSRNKKHMTNIRGNDQLQASQFPNCVSLPLFSNSDITFHLVLYICFQLWTPSFNYSFLHALIISV